jgi:hypothetical protein
MSIKLVLLRTGETVISDICEMVLGEDEEKRVVGYFLNNPCAIIVESIDENSNLNEKTKMSIRLLDWMPLSKDKSIPIISDWVVSIVDPVDSLKETYENSYSKREV